MFKVRGTLKASSRNRVHFAASPGLRWLIRSLALWAWDVHLTGPSLNFVISKIEVSVCSIWWQECFLRTYACTHVHTHATWFAASCLIPGSIWSDLRSRGSARGSAGLSEPAGPAAGNCFLPLLRDHFSGSAGTVPWLAVCLLWPSVSITFCPRGQPCWPSRVKLFLRLERKMASGGYVMAAFEPLLSAPQTTRVQDPDGCLVCAAVFLSGAPWCWAATIGDHCLCLSLGWAEENHRALWLSFYERKSGFLSFSPPLSQILQHLAMTL